ncbi:DUF4179 domain-containing protein [Bacillus sp. 03113]|uniref:DUF4179 domain-containing protein n=1 Tax=Bacillus sp. 03113 TaxID=2578211 RepID=UPI001141D1E9|nr:DUF4179 domain-containing protein [Bacillus sp. 03113]
MFDKEKRELEKSRYIYNFLSISEEKADLAILEGIKRVKSRKKKKHLPIKMLLTASILIITFISSVNVSDTVADYVSNIPGIDKIIGLVRYDKGLLAAVENNYIQKIDATDEHDGIKVTLDSIIHDEKNLIFFYKYQADNEELKISPENIKLLNNKGEPFPDEVLGQLKTGNKDSLLEIRYRLTDREPLPKDLILSFQFSKNWDHQEGVWNIPFTLDEEKFAAKKVLELNKTVEIEGQEITFKKVTLYPSLTAVDVLYNLQNSKQIFGINDLQLEDEKGQIWKSNHLEPIKVNKNEETIYLESNYFTNPKELHLRFNSIRALDKDEIWVTIDPINQKILKAPKDGKLSKVETRSDELYIQLEAKPYYFNKQLFMYAEDMQGNIIGKNKPFGAGWSPGDDHITYKVPYSSEEAGTGPVKLELIDYPTTIQKEVKLKIK